MEDYYTIITFDYPSEAYPLRSLLESEGIECFLKDEINIQINPLGSNALGGVKLQVKSSDIKAALDIMGANGYSVPVKHEMPEIWHRFDEYTKGFPLIGQLEIVYKFLFIAAVLIFIAVMVALRLLS